MSSDRGGSFGGLGGGKVERRPSPSGPRFGVLGLVINPRTGELFSVEAEHGYRVALRQLGERNHIEGRGNVDDPEFDAPFDYPRAHTAEGVRTRGVGNGTALYTALAMAAVAARDGQLGALWARGAAGIYSLPGDRSEDAERWWTNAAGLYRLAHPVRVEGYRGLPDVYPWHRAVRLALAPLRFPYPHAPDRDGKRFEAHGWRRAKGAKLLPRGRAALLAANVSELGETEDGRDAFAFLLRVLRSDGATEAELRPLRERFDRGTGELRENPSRGRASALARAREALGWGVFREGTRAP